MNDIEGKTMSVQQLHGNKDPFKNDGKKLEFTWDEGLLACKRKFVIN